MHVLLSALLALLCTISVSAQAETDDLDVQEETDVRFMKNFEARIKQLENYTVTYVAAGAKVHRAPTAVERDGVSVKLIPVKKKS